MLIEPLDLYCKKQEKALQKKQQGILSGYPQSMTLLKKHFCSKHEVTPVSPTCLFRITDGEDFSIWKFQIMVKGSKPNYWPRLWLAVIPKLDCIVPLALGVHTENYKDNERERTARVNLTQYLQENSED